MATLSIVCAVAWTHWLSVPILFLAVGTTLIAGYWWLFKVVKPYKEGWAQFRVDEEARWRAEQREAAVRSTAGSGARHAPD